MHERLRVAAEDRHGGEPELLLLLEEPGGQLIAAIVGQQPFPLDDARQVPRVTERGRFQVVVVGLRHDEGLIERALDLGLEPALDRPVDEIGRDDEDQDRRQERQRQEPEHELGLELRADDLLAPFEPELDQVPEEQHQQQEQDDHVQVQEADHDQVRRDRQLGRAEGDIEGAEAGHEQEAGDDQDQVPLAPALVAEERHHSPRMIVR